MQHSLIFIFSRTLMMFFTGAVFMLIFLDMSLGVTYHSTNVTLSLYKEEVITSPGYPYRDYEKDTVYTWDVRADAATEEILINITIDINETRGFGCDDYLLIQEINLSAGNFFKRCGQLTTYRIAKGNRLLVTLVSNYDELTSRGFQLILKVLKVGTITTTTSSTPSTATIHVPTKAMTSESTLKTTVSLTAVPLTTITTAKVQTSSTTTTSTTTTSTTTPSTTTPTTTTSTTTTTTSTTTTSTTSTPKLTTQAMSLTPPPTTKTTMTPNTNATTSIKSKSPLISTAATSALITSDGNATASTKTIPILRSSSFQSTETRKTSFQTTTKTQPNQSSTSETTNIRTLMDTVTGKDTTSTWNMFGTLEKKTVILLIGLGVLEVTLIVVGVLAVQRYRRKRKYYPSRQVKKRNGDHTNALKRQNSCRETHVYDEIDIDDVKEKEKEESQYKELPEGVYDTTLKRRSHLKVVGERISNYSRGSIINMFRTSSFFKRKVNETSVMTFSSFKGPVQSQIGEKK